MSNLILKSAIAGEIPPPVAYQFLDSEGTAVGWALDAKVQVDLIGADKDVTPTVTLACDLDAATGTASYQWVTGDLDLPGRYQIRFWVTNGPLLAASDLIQLQVLPHFATTPTFP